MKSFDVCECGAPLKLVERPTPKPTGSEVLLKVLAAEKSSSVMRPVLASMQGSLRATACVLAF